MDRPQGRIIALLPDTNPPRALVEVVTAMRCARCAAGKGCGAGLIGGDGGSRHVEALLPGHLGLDSGDTVWLELDSQDLLRVAVVAYGAPLAGILVAASGAWAGGLGEWCAVVATVLGGLTGAASARLYLRRRGCMQRFTPRVSGSCAAGPP
jgi:sigma-E factor negative regulatory protein RseC